MKCPNCNYLVHAEPEVCPNCGFAPSSAEDRPESMDLATSQGPEGPLADFAIGARADVPEASARAAPARLLLPFPTTDTRKPAAWGRPRVPLSVRRKTPEVPRLRARTARSGAAELAVSLDLEAAARPETEARPASRGRAPEAASLGARLIGALIDAALVGAIDGAVVYFTLRLAGLPVLGLDAVPLAPLGLFLLLLTFGYHVGLTWAGGQTIGKMAVGIRVVRVDGRPLSWTAAFLRVLASLLSALPLGLGLLAGWLRRDRATLHDRLCGTRVVKLSH